MNQIANDSWVSKGYLRLAPTAKSSRERLYGRRQDPESRNAHIERTFYGRRLPAWGVHKQTLVLLMAAFAEHA